MGTLTALQVKALVKPGRYPDGDGLRLDVKGPSQRAWVYRFTSPKTGKERYMGLGPYPEVSLAEAREAHATARAVVRSGRDPIDVRDAANAPVDVAKGMTFKAAMEATIKMRQPTWKDPKAEHTWRNGLSTHAADLMARHCREITTTDVRAVLEPIWTTKTTTATRLRERIEIILDYAATHDGWSDDKPNAARWKGALSNLLAAPGKVHKTEHHAALPFKEAPEFFKALRKRSGIGARALEFTILTGQRSGPVMTAHWSEVDLEQGTWKVPAGKMKSKEAHTVPLTPAMLRVLESMKPLRRQDQGDWVFPGQKLGKPISNMTMAKVLVLMGRSDITVHGFRATLRTWSGDKKKHEADVAEAVLDHVLPGGAVRAAYQRGDLLDKRRALHVDWERYLGA